MTDYRLLSVGERLETHDEEWSCGSGRWEPKSIYVGSGEIVQPDDNPIRRRTTLSNPTDCDASRILDSLRDELAELAEHWDRIGAGYCADAVRNILAKHYPQEPQS